MTLTAARAQAPLVVHGWSIYAHPIFLDQLDALIREVEARKTRNPTNWQKKNCAKRLAAIFKLVTKTIPTDPGTPQFRQGETLGNNQRHGSGRSFPSNADCSSGSTASPRSSCSLG